MQSIPCYFVGQKVHPTGFRVGINKKHSTTWFVERSLYSTFLKEDFLIRQLIEKEWNTLYTDAGISKLEIQRKLNQFELLIHAAYPKKIRSYMNRKRNSFMELRTKFHKLFEKPKQLRIVLLKVLKANTKSSIVARSLSVQLEKRVKSRTAIYETIRNLENTSVNDFKLQLAGRIDRAEKAETKWIRRGRVALQTIRFPIDYSTKCAYTKNGVIGIKVWISCK